MLSSAECVRKQQSPETMCQPVFLQQKRRVSITVVPPEPDPGVQVQKVQRRTVGSGLM